MDKACTVRYVLLAKNVKESEVLLLKIGIKVWDVCRRMCLYGESCYR